MTQILADARLALRAWRRAPVFTVIAVASIALGIGATTAIFTLVDQVLLRLLPIKDPQQLVQVSGSGLRYGSTMGDGSELSVPMYQDLRDHNQVFAGMLGRTPFAMQIGFSGQTERVAGELVTGSYFPVLGVGAAVGRVLTQDDDRQPGGHPVAVLSHGFWTTRFGADPTVVGRGLVVNGKPYTIVGVAREGFEGIEMGRPAQLFVPIMMKADITPTWNALDDRRYYWLRVFARLRDGVTAEQAQAALQPFYRSRLEMEVKERAFAKASPRTREQFLANQLTLTPGAQGRSNFRQTLSRPLWVLMGIAGGVLLIACANVANLLLARGAGRQREMAVRLALGASRTRLVRQLLVESIMLALAGALGGLAIAALSAPIVLGFFVSPEAVRPVSTLPDLRILAFTSSLAMLTGILFGLAPALQSTRPNVAPTLKDQAGAVLGGGQARLRKALVASQVAVSLLLLIGAGLFIRTLNNLLAVDIGLAAPQIITFSVDPSLNGYPAARTQQFAQSLLERLNAMPGVTRASLNSRRVLDGSQWSSYYTIEGYTPKGDEIVFAQNSAISPGYLEAMGIPLLAGRDFDQRDFQAAPSPEAVPSRTPAPVRSDPLRVALVNETFVKRYVGGQNPIGRHFGFGNDPGTPTPTEIVGVVKDAKYTGVRDETLPQVFYSFFENRPGGFTVYLRVTRDADTMFRLAREAVQQLDPNLPIHGVRTLDAQVSLSLSRERMVATMSTVFGLLATLLAVIGLYGVMTYTVSRRTREIGIRMALGARVANIGWLVIREALTIAALGIALGLPAAWWLSRYVESQLFGVQRTDVVTVVLAVITLGVVAMIAGLIPSVRATRVSPTTALRYE